MQEWEVDGYLAEILLSYPLLFGQTKGSRERFQKLNHQKSAAQVWEPLLLDLCQEHSSRLSIPDREKYQLVSTFSVLRPRILRINHYLDNRKPKGWRELWLDRRDSAEWMAFWTVLVFGG